MNKSLLSKKKEAPSEQKNRHATAWWWRKIGTYGAVLILLSMAGIRFVDPDPVEALRLKTFDLYNRLAPREITTPAGQNPIVGIVDIDERTLAEEGQWPWPRHKVAKLLAKLRNAGAVVAGFDVVFAEPDKTNPSIIAENLRGASAETVNNLKSLPSNDETMANVMRTFRVVMGQASQKTDSSTVKVSDAHDSSVKGFRDTRIIDTELDPKSYLVNQPTLVHNIPVLEQAATGHGVFSVEEEVDGVVRRVPAVSVIEGVPKPALGVEVLNVALGGNSIVVTVNDGGVEDVRLQTPQGNYIIPTDPRGQVWVYFAESDLFNQVDNSGRWYVSATDILNDRVGPEKLAGRIFLVGTSAVGLLDIRNTPINARLPGVEVHANMIETIWEKQYLAYPVEMQGFEMGVLFIAGILMIFFIPRVGPMWTLGGLTIVLGGLVGTSWYLYVNELLLLDITYPGASVVIIYAMLTFANYARDSAEKEQVRTAFGQYLSPDLVEQLAENPDQLTLGGETKKMTLLFCDVRGFTTISESYKEDPQGLTRLINRLLTPLTNEILERRGTIDKYMGDCIMAFWNAPLADPDQEHNSCASALAMFKSLKELNTVREQEAKDGNFPFLPLNIGIGINTGDCVVGNMGSDQRFDYSVLGDAVNLAARLEGQSKSYGVGIVLGPETASEVSNDYATLELDLIAVKGKTEAVQIFTLLGSHKEMDMSHFTVHKEKHDEMISNFRAQNWDLVENQIASLKGGVDTIMDDFYDIYLERVATYRETPPPQDWDGVFVATTK
ncbi:CHASE2 domain-containing protein [Curvivirga aplysinae]|uniref:CHASE2 domain-containing protein n=1 Tax=Curvivirga aplysinae TaxID=2529852 RepID=UPI0012BC1B8B|nr:adenylate/guanylate cyclase domain-containing protein [Curvivirga aplysinae]MTI09564.1 adenylate/guanylate cyclase domain-containing protein [Curvivirga aplysinae]